MAAVYAARRLGYVKYNIAFFKALVVATRTTPPNADWFSPAAFSRGIQVEVHYHIRLPIR